MARRKYGEGDVCERRRGRMKRAKRSGSNLGCGEQTTAHFEPWLLFIMLSDRQIGIYDLNI